MANRFPLVVDSDTNQIKEIPAGDNLDFSSVGVANLSSLSVAGAISGATVSATGDLSVGGNETITGTLDVTGTTTLAGVTASGTINAANFTVSGNPLSTIQVQSDWNVSDTNSAAFIKNKPTLSITVDNLDDIGDVFVSDAVENDVLTYDGVSWQASQPTGGITTFDTPLGTPSGQGSVGVTVTGSTATLTYNPPTAAGINAATSAQGSLADSAVQPGDSLSDLSNTTTRFTTYNDIQISDPLTKTPISNNQFSIGFNNAAPGAGFLTAESDTLADVVSRGNITLNSITVRSINAVEITATSEFQNIDALGITFNAGGIGSENGSITLDNGNLTATTGTITGRNLVGTNQISTVGLVDTPVLRNAAGDLTLQSNVGGRVQITQGTLKIVTGESRPSGQLGDIYHTGTAIEAYFNDTGAGGAGWVHIAGPATNANHGILVPIFTTTERNLLPARPGEMILNVTTSKLEVWDGVSSWIVVGP
jgi:hypothetical protein